MQVLGFAVTMTSSASDLTPGLDDSSPVTPTAAAQPTQRPPRLGGPWICSCRALNNLRVKICPVCGKSKPDSKPTSTATGGTQLSEQDALDSQLLDASRDLDPKRVRLLIEKKVTTTLRANYHTLLALAGECQCNAARTTSSAVLLSEVVYQVHARRSR